MACNLCNKRFVQSIIIKFIHGSNYWRTILDAIFRNKIQMIIIEIKMTFSASITHSNRTANSNGYKRALYPTKSTLINSITMNCTFDINSPVWPYDSFRRPNERKKVWWWTHTQSYKNCSLICFGCAYLFECISMRTLYALCNKNVLNLKLIITF